MATCAECHFFLAGEFDFIEPGRGGCHRHPPAPRDLADIARTPSAQIKSYFADTRPEWWCGEFRPAGGAPVAEQRPAA